MKHAYTEAAVHALSANVHLLKAGHGDPVLVLHHDVGNPGWLPFYDALASHFSVYVPSHPGFGKSDRLDWMRTVRDMAAAYQWILEKLGIERVSVVGLGFGGWIAAEMSTMCPHRFRKMVLVGAMGLQPREGEILDQFLISTIDYVEAGFHDPKTFTELYGEEPSGDQLELWEINREMTTRIAWKPYMYSQELPFLLPSVATPALIVWGRDDKIVPLECGEMYRSLLPNAKLKVLERCGHFAEVEQAQELAQLTMDFLTAAD